MRRRARSVFRLPSLGRRLSVATSCAFALLLRVSVIVALPLDEVCCDFQAVAWGHGKPPATKGNGHTLTYALSIGRRSAEVSLCFVCEGGLLELRSQAQQPPESRRVVVRLSSAPYGILP